MRCMREGAPIGGMRGFCRHPPANRPPSIGDRPIAHRLGCEERDPHAKARRHQQSAHHRLRPDHHRSGVRVRLLRHAGLQGPAPARIRGGAGQQQPRHHHDRSRHGGRRLHRAAQHRAPRADHRQGAPRRAAAQPGRPIRPEPGRRPGQAGHPREIRRAGHRRPDRRDRTRRGPRGVQGAHGVARHRDGAQQGRLLRRGRRRHRRRAGIPLRAAPRLHHGRHGRRTRVQHRRAAHGGRTRPGRLPRA